MLALFPLLTLVAPNVSNPWLEAIEPLTLHPAPVVAPVADNPEMEYTYIEANVVWADSDDLNEDLVGGELIGSFELPLNLFIQATASRLSDDSDLTRYKFGLGWHIGFTERLDAYGILSYQRTELEFDDGDFDANDDSPAAEIGLRALITPTLEINGRATWVDVDDVGEDSSNYTLGAGARYYFNTNLSVGGRIEFGNAENIFAAGVRFEL